MTLLTSAAREEFWRSWGGDGLGEGGVGSGRRGVEIRGYHHHGLLDGAVSCLTSPRPVLGCINIGFFVYYGLR